LPALRLIPGTRKNKETGSMKRLALHLALALPALLAFAPAAYAAPSAKPAPKAAAAPELYEYHANLGDTLTSISARYLERGTDWPQLMKVNKIADPNRIAPGEIVRIPIDLMKRDLAALAVATARGQAQVQRNGVSTPLAAGAALQPGDEVSTGQDGYVVIRLADGSVLRLQADSKLVVQNSEKLRDTDVVRSFLRLVTGRVESLVSKFKGAGNRFEVTTQQAVTGVRGTDFRVAVAGDATSSEVLEGRVAFDGAGAAAGKNADLAAGFGSKASGDGQLLAPVQLLAAPALANASGLQERLVVRFEVPALTGAVKYRAQVSRDAEFFQVLQETTSETPNIRFAGLDDGPYFLRVRGIDANGLEGRDAVKPFTLKARPEPPLISAPADRGKVRADPVEFAWAAVGNNAKYRVQIARDAAFANVVHEAETAETKLTAPARLPLGEYFWRIRTIEGNDTGPWSDVRSFNLLAPPAVPEPPQLDGNRVKFSWSGEPGQTFVFQVSTDPKFGTLLYEEKLSAPALDKPKPRSGVYYMRYRAIDADGFEGPFTAPQRFTIDLPRVGNSSNIFTGE
jgi:hypothetical protein